MLRAAAPLLLLQPSCLLAMVALVPRALSAPTPGSLGVVAALGVLAVAPVFVVLRRVLSPA